MVNRRISISCIPAEMAFFDMWSRFSTPVDQMILIHNHDGCFLPIELQQQWRSFDICIREISQAIMVQALDINISRAQRPLGNSSQPKALQIFKSPSHRNRRSQCYLSVYRCIYNSRGLCVVPVGIMPIIPFDQSSYHQTFVPGYLGDCEIPSRVD